MSSNTTSPSPGIGEPGGFVLYYYTPSLGASALFTVIFFLSALLHLFQIVRTKTYFFIPMLLGALMEGVGYIGRILSASNTKALGPYIMQSVLLLVAPALFAASIYIILGRLIVSLEAQRLSLVRVDWLTRIFVSIDVLSFLIQSTGGGLSAKGDSLKMAEKIILGGLFVQIIGFGVFIIVTINFHLRMNKEPAARKPQTQPSGGLVRRLFLGPRVVNWTEMLWVLYIASSLIMVRSIFRVVEFAQGFDGYLLRNEVWLFIFDALLMFMAVAVFHPYHPSKLLGLGRASGNRYNSEREDGGVPLDHRAGRV